MKNSINRSLETGWFLSHEKKHEKPLLWGEMKHVGLGTSTAYSKMKRNLWDSWSKHSIWNEMKKLEMFIQLIFSFYSLEIPMFRIAQNCQGRTTTTMYFSCKICSFINLISITNNVAPTLDTLGNIYPKNAIASKAGNGYLKPNAKIKKSFSSEYRCAF